MITVTLKLRQTEHATTPGDIWNNNVYYDANYK